MDSIQTTNTVFEIFEQIPVEKRYGIIQRLKSEVIKRNSFVQLTELEFKGIRITPQIDELIKNQELFIGHRQTDDLGRQDVEYVSLWFLPKTQFVYRERCLDDCVFRNQKCDYKAIVQIRRILIIANRSTTNANVDVLFGTLHEETKEINYEHVVYTSCLLAAQHIASWII